MKIDKKITIEDLVDEFPFSVNFLSKKGIKCIACGEPIWGTLEEACIEKNFSQKEIQEFVTELNDLIKIKIK
ncbi:MAG: DUF1858 domain-containing protein [Bacteroidetes bacterium]|nr:MAG: DUF1858 domain-containing protein [Bacteroidota bacterium]